MTAYQLDPTEALDRLVAGRVEAAREQKYDSVLDIQPVTAAQRSGNVLRPSTLDEMVGQEKLKPLLRRLIDSAHNADRPLDHMILFGASGTGKSTVALIVANELKRRVFQIDAPVSHEMLVELCDKMIDGDILYIDEIHRQVAGDRRGVTAACQPEIFYHVLEDRRLVTAGGVLPFPEITVIGATTDAGLLPEPFLGRFPLKPCLDRYTDAEMATIAKHNADALGLVITDEAADVFGAASRANPRQVNTYVRNARALAATTIDADLAREVVTELNGSELDGLTRDMALMLRFLYLTGRREKGDGTVTYQASVNTIATALGKSRDTKAIALYVEPTLIERGLVQVAHGGRLLTEAGIKRAQELVA